jgi:flagellar basal-body rod protein FlgF
MPIATTEAALSGCPAMDLNSSVAASRLIAQQHAMDVTANNIANANTPGFKLQRVQFSDWLSRQSGADVPHGGTTVAFTQDRATWRDQQAGTVTRTGNTFDLALAGDGAFTVSTPRGTRLTRDGRFGPLPDGTLADGAGNPVLDTAGQPIRLPPNATNVSVASDGTISNETGQFGKIAVLQPIDPMTVRVEGGTLLDVSGGTTPVAAPGIVQGSLEGSNVQPVLEVTRMMNDTREFQFLSQFIQLESDRQQSAIDKLLPANG